jgi:hydrogenase maturation protease
MTATAPRIGVFGLGNVLMGDDAVGPYVVEVLRASYEFPDDVAVLDLGTPGLDLTPYVAGMEALVLVDAVKAQAPAGTVRQWRRDEILRTPPAPRLSPHDPGVKEALLIAEATGQAPREVLLVGIVPEKTETGIGLTPAVREAVDWAVIAVLIEMERLGAPGRPRERPAPRNVWWEATPA